MRNNQVRHFISLLCSIGTVDSVASLSHRKEKEGRGRDSPGEEAEVELDSSEEEALVPL